MLTEDERRAIVQSGPIYLKNGLRATMGGIMNNMCSITSAEPGFWHISWESAQRITERPDRRMDWLDNMFCAGWGWLGCLPAPRSDWQTEADYIAAKARGDAL